MPRTAKTMTANGNAQIDTAQSVFGGASGLFDGTGDFLTTPDSDDWDFTSTDCAIDFRLRAAGLGSGSAKELVGQYNGTGNHWFIYHYITGEIAVGISSTSEIATTFQIAINTWYHIAITKSGTTTRIFVDGVQKASNTTTVFNNSANLLYIAGGSGGGFDLNGWIDELRISNVARWTADFTPPTAAYTNDDNTLLLLHMDGTDGSTTFTDDAGAAAGSSSLLGLMGVGM